MDKTMNNSNVVYGGYLAMGITIAAIAFFALGASYAYAQITSQLDLGARGAQVTQLQQFLATDPSIYPEGLVTGYFGPLTQAAVQRLQARQGIVSSGTPATTGYGRVGPMTMASINALMGAIGGPSVSDLSAPVITNRGHTISGTNVTMQWNTNEAATARVMYSTSRPFLYATAPSASVSGLRTAHIVSLTGLQPNTTYHYVSESVDPSGNIQWTQLWDLTTGQ